MAEAYLTKTLFKYLGRHIPKEALAGNKETWKLDIMALAVSLIENRYKILPTINRNLTRFKAFIDSLESDPEPESDLEPESAPEPEGGPEPEGDPEPEGAHESKIDQTPLITALIRVSQAIEDKNQAAKTRKKYVHLE